MNVNNLHEQIINHHAKKRVYSNELAKALFLTKDKQILSRY